MSQRTQTEANILANNTQTNNELSNNDAQSTAAESTAHISELSIDNDTLDSKVDATSSTIRETKITRLDSVKCPDNYTVISLYEAINEIINDTHKKPTEKSRSLATEKIEDEILRDSYSKDSDDYSEASRRAKVSKRAYMDHKLTLPTFHFSGTFINKVDNDSFDQSSGLFHYDIDNIADNQMESIGNKLQSIPSCVFNFISPSGRGYKGAIRIDHSLVICDADFKQVFNKISTFFSSIDVEIDPSCKDVRRACFAVYDANIYVNYSADVFDLSTISLSEDVPPTSLPTQNKPTTTVSAARVEAALKYIDDYSYKTWFMIASAIRLDLGNEGFGLFHNWSKLDKVGYTSEDDCQKVFASANRTEGTIATCGSIFHHAQAAGWNNTIDIDSALNHIEKTDDLAIISQQIAELMDNGFKRSDSDELVDTLIARNNLGHVKTILKSKINTRVADMLRNRKPVEITNIIPTHTQLNPLIFPDAKCTAKTVKLKATRENLEKMLEGYGIKCSYNVISKDPRIEIPGIHYSKVDSNMNEITSMCNRNEIPDKAVNYLGQILEAHSFNPVLDCIKSKPWDKTSRLADFYATVEVAPEYAHIKDEILLLTLLQAVAAADHGESSTRTDKFRKFEYVLVLQGSGGLKKSSWIKSLLPPKLAEYFNDGQGLDLNNKDDRIKVAKYWICELGEIGATFKKSDQDAMKAFLSNSYDELRVPYGKTADKFERRTCFIGTVNDEEFLHDLTGNRRYLTLAVTRLNAGHDIDMQQLWAEVYEKYLADVQWWPDDELDKQVALLNDIHIDKSPVISLLEDTFDLSKPNQGQHYKASEIKYELDSQQNADISTLLDAPDRSQCLIRLSDQRYSREIKKYLTLRGFTRVTINGKRGWRLTKPAMLPAGGQPDQAGITKPSSDDPDVKPAPKKLSPEAKKTMAERIGQKQDVAKLIWDSELCALLTLEVEHGLTDRAEIADMVTKAGVANISALVKSLKVTGKGCN